MKSVKKMVVLLAAITTIVGFAGCASSAPPQANEPTVLKTAKPPAIIQDMGTASGGIIKQPEWVQYVADQKSLQKNIKDYSKDTIFVVQQTGANLDAVRLWMSSAQGPQEIAALFSQRLETVAKATAEGDGLAVSPERALEISQNIVTSIEFSGVQKQGEWWVQMRMYDPDSGEAISNDYTAYLLYSIPKERLEPQIASVIARISGQDNSAMKAFYDRLVQNIISSDFGIDTDVL